MCYVLRELTNTLLINNHSKRCLSSVVCSGTIQKYISGNKLRLNVGDSLKWKRVLTQSIISGFADITCDHNPIHSDQGNSIPIAHGMLYGSMFSAIIGTYLPGTMYMKQTLEFIKTVPVDSEVEATIEIKRLFSSRRIVVLITSIKNEKDEVVCSGESTICIPYLTFSSCL